MASGSAMISFQPGGSGVQTGQLCNLRKALPSQPRRQGSPPPLWAGRYNQRTLVGRVAKEPPQGERRRQHVAKPVDHPQAARDRTRTLRGAQGTGLAGFQGRPL